MLFNINDPPPAPGRVQPRRPFQPFGPIGIYQSGRNTISNQIQLGAVKRFAGGFGFQFEYQFTNALSEQPFGITPPTDNRNAWLAAFRYHWFRNGRTLLRHLQQHRSRLAQQPR